MMTENEQNILKCAAVFAGLVVELSQKESWKSEFTYLNMPTEFAPLPPLEHESVATACHRIFGSYVYNQVFSHPPR